MSRSETEQTLKTGAVVASHEIAGYRACLQAISDCNGAAKVGASKNRKADGQ
jgi:hypothetical protein